MMDIDQFSCGERPCSIDPSCRSCEHNIVFNKCTYVRKDETTYVKYYYMGVPEQGKKGLTMHTQNYKLLQRPCYTPTCTPSLTTTSTLGSESEDEDFYSNSNSSNGSYPSYRSHFSNASDIILKTKYEGTVPHLNPAGSTKSKYSLPSKHSTREKARNSYIVAPPSKSTISRIINRSHDLNSLGNVSSTSLPSIASAAPSQVPSLTSYPTKIPSNTSLSSVLSIPSKTSTNKESMLSIKNIGDAGNARKPDDSVSTKTTGTPLQAGHKAVPRITSQSSRLSRASINASPASSANIESEKSAMASLNLSSSFTSSISRKSPKSESLLSLVLDKKESHRKTVTCGTTKKAFEEKEALLRFNSKNKVREISNQEFSDSDNNNTNNIEMNNNNFKTATVPTLETSPFFNGSGKNNSQRENLTCSPVLSYSRPYSQNSSQAINKKESERKLGSKAKSIPKVSHKNEISKVSVLSIQPRTKCHANVSVQSVPVKGNLYQVQTQTAHDKQTSSMLNNKENDILQPNVTELLTKKSTFEESTTSSYPVNLNIYSPTKSEGYSNCFDQVTNIPYLPCVKISDYNTYDELNSYEKRIHANLKEISDNYISIDEFYSSSVYPVSQVHTVPITGKCSRAQSNKFTHRTTDPKFCIKKESVYSQDWDKAKHSNRAKHSNNENASKKLRPKHTSTGTYAKKRSAKNIGVQSGRRPHRKRAKSYKSSSIDTKSGITKRSTKSKAHSAPKKVSSKQSISSKSTTSSKLSSVPSKASRISDSNRRRAYREYFKNLRNGDSSDLNKVSSGPICINTDKTFLEQIFAIECATSNKGEDCRCTIQTWDLLRRPEVLAVIVFLFFCLIMSASKYLGSQYIHCRY